MTIYAELNHPEKRLRIALPHTPQSVRLLLWLRPRCHHAKRTQNEKGPYYEMSTTRWMAVLQGVADRKRQVVRVKVVTGGSKCDTKCVEAEGDECDCSCLGRFHGHGTLPASQWKQVGEEETLAGQRRVGVLEVTPA